MKEATGDMGMTIVVILGVVAVLAIGRFVWNMVGNKTSDQINKISYIEEVR